MEEGVEDCRVRRFRWINTRMASYLRDDRLDRRNIEFDALGNLYLGVKYNMPRWIGELTNLTELHYTTWEY
jgi:hypothetical protein